MTGRRITGELTSEGFAALTDHARLPSRFHARLSGIATRLRD
ncbi:hypothetical protein [Chenggangzhangella methanolivorans]|nr:hypothetical protein [Chenggangzhangella methanolivorans]